MSPPVLWQYNFSNFNEKARWALDHKRIPHRRRSLLPGSPRAMWFSLRGTLPVLDLDGERITDTTAIIAALERSTPEPSLYPADPEQRRRALELEEYFDENCGHDVRRALFWELRHDRDYMVEFLSVGQPAAMRAFLRVGMPIGWQYVKRRYTFEADAARRSASQIEVALDRVEEARRGSDYLVGESFSVADLTAAALMFPLAWPEQLQYDYPAPPRSELRESVAEHPTVAWILDIYAHHRGQSAAIS